MIGIIDYGLGNVMAFVNVYRKLNIPVLVVRSARELSDVDRVILPGVGAFDYAFERLELSGMRQALTEIVQERKAPVLGVCVGMQMLASFSEEGRHPGFGWIDGEVKKIDFSHQGRDVRVPHMGWNDVKPIVANGLFHSLERGARFYFLHSFYFRCRRPEDIAALTDYGREFPSAVRSGNVYGVQFHPEKSHHWGTQLLGNFARM